MYTYNVVLKGALKLNDTKSYLDKQCLFIHNTRVDCSNITYSMSNIPAFKEEAFMLARKNYLFIAGVKIDGELIQLDASDKLLAFGQLPIRAINGQGRIFFSKKSSEWIPLENKIVSSTSFIFNGK